MIDYMIPAVLSDNGAAYSIVQFDEDPAAVAAAPESAEPSRKRSKVIESSIITNVRVGKNPNRGAPSIFESTLVSSSCTFYVCFYVCMYALYFLFPCFDRVWKSMNVCLCIRFSCMYVHVNANI